MINIVSSATQIEQIGNKYQNLDINNDGKDDMLMYDTDTIYIKYGQQKDTHLTK